MAYLPVLAFVAYMLTLWTVPRITTLHLPMRFDGLFICRRLSKLLARRSR